MERYILILIVGFLYNPVLAQDYSDSESMKYQPYMLYADKADCDNMDGNNAEHKICLNLHFQKLDSIMNSNLLEYVAETENDTIKKSILE